MKISSEKTSSEYLSLNSCGIDFIHDRDRGSKRTDGRCDYHILYVEKGRCRVLIDNEWQYVYEGGVIFYRPYERQEYYYSKDDNSISHYLHFTGVGCEKILKNLGIFNLKFFNMGRSREYENLSRKLHYEYITSKPICSEFCAAYLWQLLCIIGRRYSLRDKSINVKSESRINAACAEIYDNISDPPSVDQLAEKNFLSTSRFLHLFKDVTGRSYKEYIAFIRIASARQYLLNTEMSVCDIAAAVGYDDQNYFSRVFKKIVGCSPTEYRREMK